MAEIKCWFLCRALRVGESGDRIVPEIMTESWPIRCTDVFAFPNDGTTPPRVAIVLAGPLAPSQANTVDNMTRYHVLAAKYTSNIAENGVDAGEPYPGFEPNSPMTTARWDRLKTKMMSIGTPESLLDLWRSNNPNGTPKQFRDSMINHYGASGETGIEPDIRKAERQRP